MILTDVSAATMRQRMIKSAEEIELIWISNRNRPSARPLARSHAPHTSRSQLAEYPWIYLLGKLD
jgi:hypothetical protein